MISLDTEFMIVRNEEMLDLGGLREDVREVERISSHSKISLTCALGTQQLYKNRKSLTYSEIGCLSSLPRLPT